MTVIHCRFVDIRLLGGSPLFGAVFYTASCHTAATQETLSFVTRPATQPRHERRSPSSRVLSHSRDIRETRHVAPAIGGVKGVLENMCGRAILLKQ